MAYTPIENYGLIGDMRTAALVGPRGSIDWLCIPRFDSPSVFAAILDEKKGGCFSVAPAGTEATSRQMYWPETNVLVTRFFNADGAAELIDFMPVGDSASERRRIVRRVTCMRGSMRLRMECRPAFNYARDEHALKLGRNGAQFHGPGLSLALATEQTLHRLDGGGVASEVTLNERESAVFVLEEIASDEDPCPECLSKEQTEQAFEDTVAYWRRWVSGCTYAGRWREMVYRSALALKLLTYEPTGAIVAAPTCALPEAIGGERNWDYRYTWIRDAAFTVYALLRLGFTEEAGNYMRFLAHVCESASTAEGPLQIMYGIDGRSELPEETLDHLEGYRGSRPVRIGNAAHDQLQLDIYGELLDAAYLYNKWGEPVSVDLWYTLRDYVDWVCEHWQREDEGIWEVRGGRRHFVYSKLMCWVAVDRGLRLAEKRSFPADRARWHRVRDEIFEDILKRGWSEKRQAFTQSYCSESLDASVAVMPLVFFMASTDPKLLSTLDAIMASPKEGGLLSNSLVYRYDPAESPDGLDGSEGTFNMCTFWLVEALTRAGRFNPERLRAARLIFERMLAFSSPVGLYAEETGHHGEALGNFPQALTHLTLISAAFNLDRALGRAE